MTVMDAPTVATPRLMSADELDRAAQSRTAELIHGEWVEKAVSEDSSRAELWIGTRLTMFLMSNPVALVYPSSMGYQVFQRVLPGDPGRVRKPDVSVIRADRRQQHPAVDPGYMAIVPDLAVEVVSPNDVWSDVVEKVREYLAAGFPLVWIAEPGFRTITVHPNGGERKLFNEAGTITAESALPGFSCKVAELFPPTLAVPEP